MAMTEIGYVRAERQGQMIYFFSKKRRLLASLDLQQEYGLSDEQTKQLTQRLDEQGNDVVEIVLTLPPSQEVH